jgi:hypothetical protein
MLAINQAFCLFELGEFEKAVPVFNAEMERLPADRVRDRASYLAYAASAHAGRGDLDSASRMGLGAARLALGAASPSVTVRLQTLYRDRRAKDHKSAEVQELASLLQDTDSLRSVSTVDSE